MIFYNGFNLMVDLIIGIVVYKIAFTSGWKQGYGEGEEDYRTHLDDAYDSYRDQIGRAHV